MGGLNNYAEVVRDIGFVREIFQTKNYISSYQFLISHNYFWALDTHGKTSIDINGILIDIMHTMLKIILIKEKYINLRGNKSEGILDRVE